MTRPGIRDVRVRDLQPGDVLHGTLQRIVSVDQPLRGESQCRVVAADIAANRRGQTRTHYWGARTTVGVIEDPTAAPWLGMTSTAELERRVDAFCDEASSSPAWTVPSAAGSGGVAAGGDSDRDGWEQPPNAPAPTPRTWWARHRSVPAQVEDMQRWGDPDPDPQDIYDPKSMEE